MSKKKTPIEEMTREQLVQSASQYKSLYNKEKIKLQEMTANYERVYKELQRKKACPNVPEEEDRIALDALQKRCADLQKETNKLADNLADANTKKARLAEEIVTLKDRIQQIKSDIETYNDLPWWKRIFKKMHTSE